MGITALVTTSVKIVANERLAADKRNVNWFVLADEIDDAIDESVAVEIV